MPARKRSRKLPLSTTHSPSVSRKVTQATISAYHVLLKRQRTLQQQLQHVNSSAQPQLQADLDSIAAEIEALGGIEAYQTASVLGQSSQRGGDTSKVLVKWLRELGCHQGHRLKMLEIGALKPDNYSACSKWIENHPIDLHSRHPDIIEQDFLECPVPADQETLFDIISCSLVLNFVDNPRDRGRMLQLCHDQLRAKTTSLLFVVLPLPCVQNSRYTTMTSFKDLVASIGFQLEREHYRPGGKVVYWLWRRVDLGPNHTESAWHNKQLLNDGPKRNNFAVLL